MVEVKQWNVIFLVDQNPPQKIILLKRSPEKSFAPNFYTGIGGKIGDLPGYEYESPEESAYRELSEETESEMTKESIKLTEFARCVYDIGLTLYYFWGTYKSKTPPHVNPRDGALTWVSTDKLLHMELIPTTRTIAEEWARRKYKTDQPFTVHVQETGVDRTVRLINVLKITDGLV